jgi:hypothetical protein
MTLLPRGVGADRNGPNAADTPETRHEKNSSVSREKLAGCPGGAVHCAIPLPAPFEAA